MKIQLLIIFSFLFISCFDRSVRENAKREILSDYQIDSLRGVLDSLAQRDMVYRQRAIDVRQNSHGVKTEEEIQLWQQQAIIDSANMVVLQKIIDKYGYPGKSFVGEDYQHIGVFLLAHNPLSIEKNISLLWAAAESGDVRKANVALLYDRMLMFKGEDQIYGTQIKFDTIIRDNKVFQKPRFWKIKDVEHVNQLRAKVGLPPILDSLLNQIKR